MATVDGTWKIEIDTPMGTQRFELALTSNGSGVTGTATNNMGVLDVRDGKVDGDVLTFGVEVTAPFPLSLSFTLTVDGDTLAGESKAGPFPPSSVTGVRA